MYWHFAASIFTSSCSSSAIACVPKRWSKPSTGILGPIFNVPVLGSCPSALHAEWTPTKEGYVINAMIVPFSFRRLSSISESFTLRSFFMPQVDASFSFPESFSSIFVHGLCYGLEVFRYFSGGISKPSSSKTASSSNSSRAPASAYCLLSSAEIVPILSAPSVVVTYFSPVSILGATTF